MRALLLIAAVAALAGATGCGSDDDDAKGEGEAYASELQAITDRAYAEAQKTLVVLNGVADGSRDARAAVPRLESAGRFVQVQAFNGLGGLDPPPDAAPVADDLEFQLEALARAIDSAASDLRVAEPGDEADAARAAASTVLAYQSGTAAVSRALRRLAIAVD